MDTTQAETETETQTEIQVESQAESQAETTNSPTNKVPKATVLVPLYIYPLTEKTWQPLYEVITAHPTVDFLVVVNPNSGPGERPLPGRDYVREVPKLNVYANVRTVGYVLIDYCKKPLSEVYEEIEAYAGWAKDYETSGLGVGGILLDETPNHYTPERAEYLDAVHRHVKATEGLQGNRLVIHNPGTPPDSGLANPGPDVFINCEEPYERYLGEEVQKRLKDYHYDQPKSGYMISGVPEDKVAEFVRELRHRAAYLFVTDLVDNFYESFGPSWGAFVAAFEDDTL